MNNKKKVVVSAITRYHLFDLAVAFNKIGALNSLITSYPKFRLGKYEELATVVESLPHYAMALKLNNISPKNLSSNIQHLIYREYAKSTKKIFKNSGGNILYGLSGFLLECVQNGNGDIIVVDHGSLHINEEKEIMENECCTHGFSRDGNWSKKWLIDRMNYEFSFANKIVCCSELAKQTFIKNGVSRDKLIVNKPKINKNIFKSTDSKEHKKTTFDLLYAGAVSPLKGLHILIDAFSELPANFTLKIIGATSGDIVLMNKINAMIRKTDRIKYIPPVTQKELSNYMNEADIFVLPSLSDGWGMVVSQALACNTPIIVSTMAGSKEDIVDGVNGYIFNVGSSENLLEKILLAEKNILELNSGVISMNKKIANNELNSKEFLEILYT
jgi:glycosyltransferase involved in cell wall biosynthesis